MTIDQTQNHKAHLTHSERGWILIYQGSPLCDYKKTYDEVIQTVNYYKIKLPPVIWCGDTMQWIDGELSKNNK
jgi:hypothetical protein